MTRGRIRKKEGHLKHGGWVREKDVMAWRERVGEKQDQRMEE